MGAVRREWRWRGGGGLSAWSEDGGGVCLGRVDVGGGGGLCLLLDFLCHKKAWSIHCRTLLQTLHARPGLQ